MINYMDNAYPKDQYFLDTFLSRPLGGGSVTNLRLSYEQDKAILRIKASSGGFFLFEFSDGTYYATRAADIHNRQDANSSFTRTACPTEPERHFSSHVFADSCIPCSEISEYNVFKSVEEFIC